MNYKKIDKTIELFYGFFPYGSNFSDATYGLFKDNQAEMYETKNFLLEEGILEIWGDAGKLIISKRGKDIWEKFASTEKYLEDNNKKNAEQERFRYLEKQKLIHDSKISKWQAKTFWWVFFIGLIGGICGIISLVMQIQEKTSNPKPTIENVKSQSN
jgi:hypothetical protein